MGFLEDLVKDLVRETVVKGAGSLNAGIRRANDLPTTVKPGGAKGGKVIYSKSVDKKAPKDKPSGKPSGSGGKPPIPKSFKPKYGMAGLRRGMGLPTTAKPGGAPDHNPMLPVMAELLADVDKSKWISDRQFENPEMDLPRPTQRFVGAVGNGLDGGLNRINDFNNWMTFTERGWGADPEYRDELIRSGKARRGNGGINWNPYDGKL